MGIDKQGLSALGLALPSKDFKSYRESPSIAKDAFSTPAFPAVSDHFRGLEALLQTLDQ